MKSDQTRAIIRLAPALLVALATACNSPSNDTQPAATDTQAPTSPTDVTAKTATSSQIDLSWNAATDNLAVAGYKIYRDGRVVAGSATTQYLDGTLDAGMTYSYAVSAVDNAGNESALSAAVLGNTANVDVIAPTVSFSFPTQNAAVSGSVNITANASDNVGVAGVQFKLDGNTLGTEDVVAPYSMTWDTSTATNASHTLVAIARDAAGNTTSVSINVVVNNADAQAPSTPMNLVATTGSSSQIKLTWSASTDNIGVAGYRVFRGGVFISNSTITQFTDNGLNSGSTYSYTVSAFDNAGNESAPSAPALGSTAAVDGVAPTVSFSFPTQNATVFGSVTITANASDNVSVAGVQFKLDGTNLGAEDLTMPFSMVWNTLASTNAPHTLMAVSRDAAGNSASATITVIVNNVDIQAPSKPANLSANASSSSQINLSWSASTDNVGVTGYKIYRNGTQIATSATPSYSDKSLTAATTYSYAVSAYDAAGNESLQSIAAQATTLTSSSKKSYSTNFDFTEGVIFEGGVWSHAGLDWANVKTAAGYALGTQTGTNNYDDSYATLSGYAADHVASAVIHISPSLDPTCSHEVELHLRWSDSAHSAKGYEISLPFSGGVQIVRWNGALGDFTFVNFTSGNGSTPAPKEGDVLQARMVGNVITVFYNGAQVAQATDSTFTTGNPGIGFFRRNCGTNEDFSFTSFTASDY